MSTEDGNLLEVVSMPSSHGTRVAPEWHRELRLFPFQSEAVYGVAQGAQIVSISIGDRRLGSMMSGKAL